MSYTNEGLQAPDFPGTYDPRDDYTDGDLALMDPEGDWPPCVICGWSPDFSRRPHAVFVAQSTYCTPHRVMVDSSALKG